MGPGGGRPEPSSTVAWTVQLTARDAVSRLPCSPHHRDPDTRHASCHRVPQAAPRDAGGRVSDDLHIEVRGAGAPLVLLHGWAMHGGVFAPLAERLADAFELHLVDLPGHGRSRDSAVPLEPAAVVDAIAARVPVAPWLGWSLGGMFALRAAATRPEAVPGLLMLCSVPRFVREPAAATTDDSGRYGMSPEV